MVHDKLIWSMFYNTGKVEIYLFYKELDRNSNGKGLNLYNKNIDKEVDNIIMR